MDFIFRRVEALVGCGLEHSCQGGNQISAAVFSVQDRSRRGLARELRNTVGMMKFLPWEEPGNAGSQWENPD